MLRVAPGGGAFRKCGTRVGQVVLGWSGRAAPGLGVLGLVALGLVVLG